MFDEERLREVGHAERLRLIRALVAMESLDSASDQAHHRGQAVGLAATIICCVILAAWIGVLAVTLLRLQDFEAITLSWGNVSEWDCTKSPFVLTTQFVLGGEDAE